MTMPDLLGTQYTYLIPESGQKYWRYTVVFLNRKVFVSSFILISKKCRETKNENKKQKHWYQIHSWSDKDFYGTFVNRVMKYLKTEAYEGKDRILKSLIQKV